MARLKPLSRFPLRALVIVLICGLGVVPAGSQTTVTDTMPTTACVQTIVKFYLPSGPPGTNVIVAKLFTTPQGCSLITSNNATCSTSPVSVAAQGAPGSSPSCQWNCGVCGTITTDGSDGLPVELMDFAIED